jgi:hypothetical protein
MVELATTMGQSLRHKAHHRPFSSQITAFSPARSTFFGLSGPFSLSLSRFFVSLAFSASSEIHYAHAHTVSVVSSLPQRLSHRLCKLNHVFIILSCPRRVSCGRRVAMWTHHAMASIGVERTLERQHRKSSIAALAQQFVDRQEVVRKKQHAQARPGRNGNDRVVVALTVTTRKHCWHTCDVRAHTHRTATTQPE